MNERRQESEDRLSRLLAVAESGAAPPDRAALAALRDRSTAAFIDAGREPVLTHQQKSTIFFARALIALAATAAVVAIAMFASRTAPLTGNPLDQSLARFGQVSSFRAQLVRG